MTPNLIARAGSMLRIAFLAVLGGTLAVGTAQAQLGAIFGDSPPRPPADVPNRLLPPQPPPVQYPGPAPLPSPSPGPPSSGIQSQPLPPPPGAAIAPPPTSGRPMAPLPPPAAQRSSVGPAPAGPLPQLANPPPPQPADTSPQPDDTVITEMPAQKIENSRAIFSGLDKITGRIISFDAAVGETVQFGALQVTARVCYTRPPTEATNTDAFVQVDEVTLQGEVKRIFSGWMFAASPGLHAVEHPIYDVWLTDCAAPIKVAEPAVPPPPAAVGTGQRPPGSRSRQPSQARQQAPAAAPIPAPGQPH
jgi:hypothetical protein